MIIARQRRSQTELATQLGKQQQWLSRRLIGVVPFTAVELMEIAELLGVPITDLLPAEGEATRKSEQDPVSPAPDRGEPGSRSGWTDSPPSQEQAVAS